MHKVIIENYIPLGYENRVSRGWLSAKVNLTDREVRRAIEAAKTPIISIDGGYFIPKVDEAPLVAKYIAQERARVRAINKKLRRFRKWQEGA